jgi:hypothetical protein
MTRVFMTATAVLGALVATACGAPCRDIEVRTLALECSAASTFAGELHFDSAAPFDTFLREECLVGEAPPAGDVAIDVVVQSVDFSTRGVFLAAGPRALRGRCLQARELDTAQVCGNGLKLYFLDEYRAEGGNCPNTRWTVAFSLPREELRAALEAGANGP